MTGASHSGRVCKKCNNRLAAPKKAVCLDCRRKREIELGIWSYSGSTRHIAKLKREALKIIGNRCWRCRRLFPKKKLHLHHLHYDTVGRETLQDVLLLCSECHWYKHREAGAPSRRKPS